MKLMLRVLMFCFTGLSTVIGSHETIKVEVGRDAILPCRLQSPLDMKRLLVEWKQNGAIVHRYRSLDDDPVQDKKYKNRTSLFKSEMPKGNVSLKLTNVTERDAGNYTCDVRVKDPVKKCTVTLNVVAKEEVIQEPSPTPKPEPVNQDPSIKAKITIPAVIIMVLLTIATAFGVWKNCEKTNAEQEPKNNDGRNKRNKRGHNRQKNKKKDNRETVSLQNVGNTSDTSS